MDGRPRQSSLAPVRTSGALWVLASIAIGTVLYVARSAFIPIAVALLVSLMLTAPVEALYRRGLPRSLSAFLILIAFVTLFSASVNLLWSPAQHWWSSAPQTLQIVENKLQPMSLLVNRVAILSDRASHLTSARKPTPAAPLSSTSSGLDNSTPQTNVTVDLLDQTRAAVVSLVTVALLTLFLMAGGPPMFARMSAALANDLRSTHVLKLIDAVRSEVSRYYGSIALINLGLGLATTAMTWLLGMPSPLVWGLVAGTLNFIPYVGAATTLLLLSVTAFVTFDTVGHVVAVAASYLALATLEGQFVQPLVVGRRLRLNPITVFLSLWFGGWFWGIAGIVMAIPALVTLKVVADHSKQGNAWSQFLTASTASGYHMAAAHQRRRKNKALA